MSINKIFYILILLIIENVVRGDYCLGDDELEPTHHYLLLLLLREDHFPLDERFGDYCFVGEGDVLARGFFVSIFVSLFVISRATISISESHT